MERMRGSSFTDVPASRDAITRWIQVTQMDSRREWSMARDRLVAAVTALGFEEALGLQMAEQLGSPKAMERMTAYLYYEKPKTVELVVDEMLAICSEIEAWRKKKEAEEYNARYNEMLDYGLDN